MKTGTKRGRGRPKSGRIQVALKFLPSTNVALTRAAKATQTTKSDFAELAILERIVRVKGQPRSTPNRKNILDSQRRAALGSITMAVDPSLGIKAKPTKSSTRAIAIVTRVCLTNKSLETLSLRGKNDVKRSAC
jgi:hypothetical protein